MKHRPLFGILIVAFVAAIAIGGLLAASGGAAAAIEPRHNFSLIFRGTPGVRLHLLLITKPNENDHPERQEEVVMLPTKIEFQAVRCYAWIDTLPHGTSGNDGDVCDVEITRDAHPYAACEGSLKKQNHMGYGLGDL